MIKIPYKHYITENKELDYEKIMPGGVTNINQTKVDKFKKAILKGDIFPKVEVIKYRHFMEIEEGYHRATAYHLLGKKIPCIIYNEDRSHIVAEKVKRRKERAEIACKRRQEKAEQYKKDAPKRALEKRNRK